MALVSGRRSTLNPNAPLFVPAAMREVEDFSPEWRDLMATSNWFKNYWLSQHRGGDVLEGNSEANNVAGLLPDSLDLDVEEDILNMETQFEEFLQSSEPEYGTGTGAARGIKNGMDVNRGPSWRMNHWEKQGKHVNSRSSPRFIQLHR